MSSPVKYTLTGNIGVISIDNPPVNALSQAVRQGIMEALDEAEKDASRALVIICEGRTFIAGADISEFGKPLQDPWLPAVVNRIEACDKPVVAAIHGTALGGGFEVALGAHYRCALSSAQVGLPEVKLGLLPGAGGTQRLPRLIGEARAKEMILLARRLTAEDALEVGLVSRLASEGQSALDCALELVEPLAKGAPIALAAALEAIDAAGDRPLEEGLSVERRCYERTLESADRLEALAAFRDKRPPRFEGR